MEDEKIQAIVDDLPDRRLRSHLEPYARLIDRLRRLKRPYREIERILSEQCGVNAPRSTINDFVRRRSQSKCNPQKSPPQRRNDRDHCHTVSTAENKTPNAESQAAVEEAYRRIAALKQRQPSVEKTAEVFRYNPDEPLQLPTTTRTREPGQ
jgi:hypothetical protein